MSEFKYLHLENFRFLTGHGKDFARAVDRALGDLDAYGQVTELVEVLSSKRGGTVNLPPGALVVHFRPVDLYAGHEFTPFTSDRHQKTLEAGMARYNPNGESSLDMILMTVLWDEARRSLVSAPLGMLLKKVSPDVTGMFQVYSHQFVTDENGESLPTDLSYIGVTRRGWRTRWSEHVNAATRGSHYRFHAAIREHGECQTMRHSIIGCFKTEAEAMTLEESMVGFETLHPLGLNMIPGGYAGMAYLHKIGASNRIHVSPDDKQDIINRFFETASRKGIPNPLASVNWQNPEYAEKVICAGEDRLKPEQIRTARFLASIGKSSQEIASEVGARNVAQVDRLLAGSTYSRVA